MTGFDTAPWSWTGTTQTRHALGAHTRRVQSSDRVLARRVVGEHTGTTVAGVAPVVERGEVNQVHVVTTGEGARYVVRSHGRAELDRYRKEAWAIEHAGAAGVLVAPVLATGEFGQRAWMLQPFLRGTPGDELARGNAQSVWRSIGEQMRRIHAVPVGGFGESLSDMVAGGQANWHKYLAYNLGELTECDPLLSLRLLDRSAQADLRRLFEHLAALPVRLGLCHGDLSLKNVIVRDGSVKIIDWGCAQGHFVPHYDLSVVIADGLGEHTAEFTALLAGYGIKPISFRRDIRTDVLALGALEAVDKVRWALDRNRGCPRSPVDSRQRCAHRASGIGQHDGRELG